MGQRRAVWWVLSDRSCFVEIPRVARRGGPHKPSVALCLEGPRARAGRRSRPSITRISSVTRARPRKRHRARCSKPKSSATSNNRPRWRQSAHAGHRRDARTTMTERDRQIIAGFPTGLREIERALGNDPFLVQECFVRSRPGRPARTRDGMGQIGSCTRPRAVRPTRCLKPCCPDGSMRKGPIRRGRDSRSTVESGRQAATMTRTGDLLDAPEAVAESEFSSGEFRVPSLGCRSRTRNPKIDSPSA
jgi:hypothetical protein